MDLNLNLSSAQVLAVLAGTVALIVLLIVFVRIGVRRASQQNLTAKYAGKQWSSPLEARTKYPDVETAQFRPYAMYIGVIAALVFATAMLNWTTVDKARMDIQFGEMIESDIEITPPQTAEPPPPPPPPQPPTVIEVPNELIEEAESVEFIDQSIEAESVVEAPAPSPEKTYVPPPPPPPPPVDDAEEIFRVVEEMPRFPGCEDIAGTQEEKRVCADRALLEFIHRHLQYPSTARENNIQGNVVAQFVVNKDGTIQDVTVLRDIGGGCGDEVIRVVKLMNTMNIKWSPGKQRGQPVRVIFILPVKFTLVVN